jgi:hypothetical protein
MSHMPVESEEALGPTIAELLAVRALRQQPINVLVHRCQFELMSLLYRLLAVVDCRRIYDEEVQAAGWRRAKK